MVAGDLWLDVSGPALSARIEELQRAVTAVSVTLTSPGGEVSVTLGPGASVTSLHLSARALRIDRPTLGDLIVSTVNRAAERVSTDVAELAGGRGFTGAMDGSIPRPPPWADIHPVAPRVRDDGPVEVPEAYPGGAAATEMDERLREVLDRSHARLNRYAEVAASLSDLTITARSEENLVAVTVRSGGGLVAVDLARGAEELGPDRLGAAIVAALGDARARAALAMAERIADITGPRLDVRAMVESAIDPTMLAHIHGSQDRPGRR